jgi:TRAP-type C4-dicarboxylate transport system substrate-binding protein
MCRALRTMAAVTAMLVATQVPPVFAEIQELSIKFVGQSSIESNSAQLEKPFFPQMTERSGNKIKVDLQPFNTLGLTGAEILRLMKVGTLEWASNGLTFLAGDRPEFEGCDLAGITTKLEDAYKACTAYRPVITRIMSDAWNVKLLALYANPPQVVWCRTPIKGLADLRGKKVRVFNKTLTDFVEGVGASGVTIPFAEVVPALQRGVADCAVTGSFNGNIAAWPEVAPHILGVYLGWALQYAAVNMDVWKKLNDDTQKFLESQFLELEKDSWSRVAVKTTAEGVTCNTGGECTLGKKANITFLNPSDDDEKERLRIMRETVVPRWAKRCGPKCAEEWNATVGKAVGLQAPTN